MSPEQVEKYKKLGMKVGKNCSFVSPGPNFGSEPYLIEFGNNVTVSFDVAFVTHDAGTRVLRNLAKTDKEKETVIYGKIKVGDNCFIGCRTTILPGVTIGENVIIGAGSVVNNDIPSNCVAAGIPCKVICSLDEYKKKHEGDFMYMVNMPADKKKKFLIDFFNGKKGNGKGK